MRASSGLRPYDISKDNGNLSDNSAWTRWQATPALTTWGWVIQATPVHLRGHSTPFI